MLQTTCNLSSIYFLSFERTFKNNHSTQLFSWNSFFIRLGRKFSDWWTLRQSCLICWRSTRIWLVDMLILPLSNLWQCLMLSEFFQSKKPVDGLLPGWADGVSHYLAVHFTFPIFWSKKCCNRKMREDVQLQCNCIFCIMFSKWQWCQLASNKFNQFLDSKIDSIVHETLFIKRMEVVSILNDGWSCFAICLLQRDIKIISLHI